MGKTATRAAGRAGRRSILGAALVAAGGAALGRTGAGTEGSAGDPLVLGRTNNAGTASTRLVAAADGPGLFLENKGGTTLEVRGRAHRSAAIVARGEVIIDDASLYMDGPRAGVRVKAAAYSALYATSGGKEPTIYARNVTRRGVAILAMSRYANVYGDALAVLGGFSTTSTGTVDVAEGDQQVVVTMPRGLVFSISVVLAAVQGPSTVGVLWTKADDENRVTVHLTGPALREPG